MVLTLPPHVCACIDQLEQAGFEAWAVGGCVRDLLRGVQPHDYDLTTSASRRRRCACFRIRFQPALHMVRSRSSPSGSLWR